MEPQNPYSAPQSQLDTQYLEGADIGDNSSLEFTHASMTALLKTRTWLSFIATTLLLVVLTSGVALLSMKDITLLFATPVITAAIGILACLLPMLIAIYIFFYCNNATKYSQVKSVESFNVLASSHSKLYASLTTACIMSLLGFFILIYYLISSIQQGVDDRRDGIEYIEATETQ